MADDTQAQDSEFKALMTQFDRHMGKFFNRATRGRALLDEIRSEISRGHSIIPKPVSPHHRRR